ncbi:MAG TPA: type IV pilus assembly protein PilM [Acidimicrobiales bacterium]
MAQRIVGLDIGTSAVRAVELTVGDGSRPVLEAYGQVGLPHGAIVDGEVRDLHGVAQALRRLWQEGGFREKRVHVGVAGLRAITRELDMPVIPPEELDNAVRFRADDLIPFPMDRTVISARVIAQYTDADGDQTLRVLVAAAHLDLVGSVAAAAEAAGLEPVSVDLNTAALVRALATDAGAAGGPEAIVSIGAGLTLVVVHQDGVLQFVRTIDLGGEMITASIAGALDLPEVDAESRKRGLAGSVAPDTRAVAANGQAVGELIDEVLNSVRFFAAQPGRMPITRLLVTGGGAQAMGLLEGLRQRSPIPVEPASPLSRVDIGQLPISPEEMALIDPTVAVPIGLSLPDRTGKPFNLLPPEVAQRASERRVRKGLVLVAGALIVLVGGLSAWRLLAVNSAKHQVTTLHTSIAQIQTVEIPKYDKAVQLKNAVAAEEKEPVPVLSDEVDWLVVLNQLGQIQPADSVVANIDLTATPPVASAPSSSATSSTSATASSTSVPSAEQVIGTASMNVTVPNLTSVTNWGQAMNSGTVLTDVLSAGTLAPQVTGVTFPATMNVSGGASSQRLSQFEEPLP